ncbi:hypothetical protein SUDANB96_06650 [Streptomyces sp. enrichment culture]
MWPQLHEVLLAKLRSANAMDRLLARKSQHSDGRLTKNNLALEAGISPATMFRATTVLADGAHITPTAAYPRRGRRSAGIDDLPGQLAAAMTEISALD